MEYSNDSCRYCPILQEKPASRKDISRLRRLATASLYGACIPGAAENAAEVRTRIEIVPVGAAEVRRRIVAAANSIDNALKY